MGKNYNIKINSKQPNSKDIAKHMDFDALLAKYLFSNALGLGRLSTLMAIRSSAIAAAAAEI